MKLAKLVSTAALFQPSTAQSYTFAAKSNASIECVPAGDTLLAFFKKDGNILFMRTADTAQAVGDSRFELDTTASTYSADKTSGQAKLVLTLTDVTLDDAGSYSCESDKGSVTPIDINVTVKPTVVLETKINDIEEGKSDTIVAICTASGAKPQPDLVWTDDQGVDYSAESTVQPSDDNRLTTVTSELKIAKVDRSHHLRKFTCTVKQAGEEVSAETTDTVNVQWKPTGVTITNEDTYTENSAATIVCSADANPDPSYRWQVQRSNETEPSDVSGNTWSVDGSNISTESLLLSDDQIKLFCVASNDFGDSEQASVTLNITAQPTPAPTSVADGIGSGAGKGAIVYSTVGVICVIVLIAGFLLAKKVLCAKKAVYKTEGDKDEAQENLNDDELEAGKKKEYFM